MITETFNLSGTEYTILIGCNKYENFKIINDSIGSDIWFHVDGEPSCHVI